MGVLYSKPVEEPKTIEQPKSVKPKAVTGTNLKSDKKPDTAKLEAWLEAKGSPLAPYASNLAESDFWALLIGICTIEQYGCTRGPNFNLWGMMKAGGERAGLRAFSSYPDAIAYMDGYFIRLYPRKQTVESLRGYYCASACTNWEPTVLKIKKELEASI